MLTKENIIEHTKDYLVSEGYEILEGNADIVAKKEQLVKFIAYGAVSDASRTSQVGKEYNKNQIKTNIALAVFNIMKLMDDTTQFVIVLPENKIYKKLVSEILKGLETFNIGLLMINEVGIVKEIN